MNTVDYELLLLSEPKYVKQRKYWLDKLSGELTSTELMPNFKKIKQIEKRVMEFTIQDGLRQEIVKVSKNMDMSIYIMMLTCLKITIFLYNGNQDIAVVSPIYKLNATRETFNKFVVLRNIITKDVGFKQLIMNIRETTIEAYNNQDFPLDKVFESLKIGKDEENLFNVTCLLKNIHDEDSIKEFKSNFDLCFEVLDKYLKVSIRYNPALYSEYAIAQFYKHFNNILKQVLRNPQIKLSEINILSDDEIQQISVEFNNTKSDYPTDKTINQLFEEQAKRNPEKLAAVFEDKQITYKELNIRADKLAITLNQNGVEENSIVAVVVKRSIETIVALLAILKSGAAYLPIDPECPEGRISYIIKDSGAKVILVQDQINLNLDTKILNINDQVVYENNHEKTGITFRTSNLAYIIYTSGTTGTPKGVGITHKNILNYVTWFRNKMHIDCKDKTMILTSLAFDLSYTSFFPALLSGSETHIISKEACLEPNQLINYMSDNKINFIKLTPSLFNVIINSNNFQDREKWNSMKFIVLGGEPINVQDVKRFHELHKHISIMNHYGPTETTVGSITNLIDFNSNLELIPIGKPISNTKVFILDKYYNILPIGVPGEICIGGDGIGIGYINNPELMDEKFIVKDINNSELQLYRTGDYGRFLSDGYIEFLGRIDNQVKVRGFRVELKEIESQLLNYEGIKEAIVINRVDENENKYLCAYVVSDKNLKSKDLRNYLAKSLYDYMIPTYFVQLEKIPLTLNGKVDINKLSEMCKSLKKEEEYLPPRNYIEEKLVEIWGIVLGENNIGISDDFFNLGGDSIKAIQVASRLYKYGLKLDVKDLFQYHSISELSNYIKVNTIIAKQESIEGEIALTPIQVQFFEKSYKNKDHYNQSVILYRKERFNEIELDKALKKIIEHHDVLRTVYKINKDKVEQYNNKFHEGLFNIKIINLVNEQDYTKKIEDESNTIQTSIDLRNGPLIKFALFKTIDGDYLLIVIHHLVVDGVSWRIIFEDLNSAYRQAIEGTEIELPLKTSSYKEWAEAIKIFSRSKEITTQLEYWGRIAQEDIKPLPKDYKIEHRKLLNREIYSMTLGNEYTEKLLKDVNKAYNTEINDILLAALGMTIKEWTGENRARIRLESHGREEIIKGIDITRTVGWFTSQYPVILNINDFDNISYILRSIKEELRHIPDKGICYGILAYLTPKENLKEYKLVVEPEINFNFLGQFDNYNEKEMFAFSDINVGMEMSTDIEIKYVLDIIGMISENNLMLSFRYDKYEFLESTIKKIVDDYGKNLKKIIEHCVQQNETKITPMDLGDKALSIEELDYISELFNN